MDLNNFGGDAWGKFGWSKETGELKQYKITEKKSSFGDVERPVITAIPDSKGKDRFYVMALKDVDESTHYWYKEASGKLDNTVEFADNDFGNGKENTKAMIDKWKNKSYGEQDTNDMWEIIQGKGEFPLVTVTEGIEGKWFVPSKSEWAAFGWLVSQNPDSEHNGFGVTSDNYETFGLETDYWSSSIFRSDAAFVASFFACSIGSLKVNDTYSLPFGGSYVRLSATF